MSYFSSLELRLFNGRTWNVAKAFVDPGGNLFTLALEQAKRKSEYTMAYSQSGKLRDKETKYQQQLMGCLAEIYAEEFFKEFLLENKLNEIYFIQRYDNVRTDGFKSAANEYDLKMVHFVSGKWYTIECRSSIAHNRNLIKAIEQFDIIGPYSSSAKEEEKYCSIYIRPLYELIFSEQLNYDPNNFKKLICKGAINLYIAGGCFRKEMMKNGYQKSMKQNNTNYRVVKLINGFDAVQFKKELSERISLLK
ncbi:MAG TPA: hypothetical protein VGW31_10165 [Hanamia sp.]|nr:hypothetical protein [Hanamia sp.]